MYICVKGICVEKYLTLFLLYNILYMIKLSTFIVAFTYVYTADQKFK